MGTKGTKLFPPRLHFVGCTGFCEMASNEPKLPSMDPIDDEEILPDKHPDDPPPPQQGLGPLPDDYGELQCPM